MSVTVVNLRPKILGVTFKTVTPQGDAPTAYLLQRVAEFAGEAIPPWTLSMAVDAIDPNDDALYYQCREIRDGSPTPE